MVKRSKGSVLALSSEVGVGDVGLSIARYVFALEAVDVIALPTVILASRPDLGSMSRFDIPASKLDEQLGALELDNWFTQLNGVMTGYFASADQVAVVAAKLKQIREQNPDALFLVDPVFGDIDTGLYVGEAVAVAVRDLLLPLADIITPNMFELCWLAGNEHVSISDLPVICTQLGVPSVVVTSASVIQPDDNSAHQPEIVTALVKNQQAQLFHSPFCEVMPKGTGDVFAAHLLSRLVAENYNSQQAGAVLSDAVGEAVGFMEGVADRVQGSKTIAPYLLF